MHYTRVRGVHVAARARNRPAVCKWNQFAMGRGGRFAGMEANPAAPPRQYLTLGVSRRVPERVCRKGKGGQGGYTPRGVI
jgi:hypothetical protein